MEFTNENSWFSLEPEAIYSAYDFENTLQDTIRDISSVSVSFYPKYQPVTGKESTLFQTGLQQDVDDPEYLSDTEIREIEASLVDYEMGRYKVGNLETLFEDLDR